MKRKQLAPHIHANQPASERYMYVLMAMLPVLVGAVFYFGIRVLILAAVSMACFFFCDFFSAKSLYPEHAFYVDYSSLVSGLMLVLLMPASASIWVVAIAAVFGSLLVKQSFGGVGTNIFNPALAARAFLQIAFPAQMDARPMPLTDMWNLSSLLTGKCAADAGAVHVDVSAMEVISGKLPGMAGVTCAVLILLGGIILFERKLFRFEAPLTYLMAILIGYVPLYWNQIHPDQFVIWVASSGILFVSVFMLNDCTTTPMDSRGRFLFGGGAGFLTILLSRFANDTYAVIFPILMMNMVTPIFDYYIRPRAFSHGEWFKEVEK
ncbi:MAG: RnfABCDGE type electron transport complex subunit D [Clostridiales bacterium]|nr:RnfABCDGE type electron transport complex subunit D [Clostridiales bacterium]